MNTNNLTKPEQSRNEFQTQEFFEFSLDLSEVQSHLACFVEYIDDENRNKYEVAYVDEDTSVSVHPIFIETGR